MVQIFRPNKGSPKKRTIGNPSQRVAAGKKQRVTIDHLDHEAKGVVPGSPIMFVTGGLPGEVCQVQTYNQQKNIIKANVLEVQQASPQRVAPFCPHFDICGGCQTQYAEPDFMLAEKQKAITRLLHKFIGKKVTSLPWCAPLKGDSRAYRRKVRLAVDGRNPKAIKLGFRGAHNEIISVTECQVLEPALQQILQPLNAMLSQFQAIKQLGHIVLFYGVITPESVDGGATVHKPQVYATLRLTKELAAKDKQLLTEFEIAQQCLVILDYGKQHYTTLQDKNALMAYTLPVDSGVTAGEDIVFQVLPDDFIQVNHKLNQAMVHRALDWLQLTAQDNVLDLFCGVGNFTLPLALQCSTVQGFEGVPEMVQMAQNNAQRNNINNVSFVSGDLSGADTLQTMAQLNCNKVLLDPARAGAYEAIDKLVSMKPEAILYVSCNPATFGRDIAKLLAANYQLTKLSLIDMFPQTAHTELMGLFIPAGK